MKRATLSLHELPDLSSHLDLFLEYNPDIERGTLTFEAQSDKLNHIQRGEKILFSEKPFHRNVYLNFEGEISKNRGNLRILWTGMYQETEKLLKKKISIVRYTGNSYTLQIKAKL